MILGQVNDIDVKLLRVFRHIVECGGMSAAELELNISRSVISRQLKDLEIRLGGLRLCNRGRAGFSLTEEGQLVYEAILRLHTSIDSFRSEVSNIHQKLTGNLVIAVGDLTTTNLQSRISDAIYNFHQIAPEVTLEMYTQPLNVIEPLVIDGTYHIGIVPLHRHSSCLEYSPLFSEEMYLYCSTLHPLANVNHSKLRWRDIRETCFVGLGYHSPNMELAKKINLNRMATTQNQESVATLIASGCYIGFLPKHYADTMVETNRLQRIENELFKYEVQYSVIAKKTASSSRIVTELMDCLIAAHGSSDVDRKPLKLGSSA